MSIMRRSGVEGEAGWVVRDCEREVEATARALVYLFSPEIDLLENASSSLQHYDKYWKSKTILWELVRTLRNSDLAGEVSRTAEEVGYLEAQVEELQAGLAEWQRQSEAQQQRIEEDQERLLMLTAAYEEAKMLFQEELRESRCQTEELRMRLARQGGEVRPDKEAKQRKESKQGREKKWKGEKELCVPQNQQSRVYTDRSIYQRFTVSHSQESCLVVNSLQPDTLSAYLPPEVPKQTPHQLASSQEMQRLRADADRLKDEVDRLKGEVGKLEGEVERGKMEVEKVRQQLLEEEGLREKLQKQLREKHRRIEELLGLMGV